MARIRKLYGPTGTMAIGHACVGSHLIDRLADRHSHSTMLLRVRVRVVMEWPRNVPIESAILRMDDSFVSNVT